MLLTVSFPESITFKNIFTIVKYMQELIYPQEIEVRYVIPALRNAFATEFKKKGLSQREIAGLLQVRESTISQYLSKKRGDNASFNPIIQKAIAQAVKRISTKEDLIRESQHILQMIRAKDTIICDLHKKHANLPADCALCSHHKGVARI